MNTLPIILTCRRLLLLPSHLHNHCILNFPLKILITNSLVKNCWINSIRIRPLRSTDRLALTDLRQKLWLYNYLPTTCPYAFPQVVDWLACCLLCPPTSSNRTFCSPWFSYFFCDYFLRLTKRRRRPSCMSCLVVGTFSGFCFWSTMSQRAQHSQ